MRFFIRLRVWFRQWLRSRAARKQNGVLREFVYLDEVSVYSLITSRLGPIAAEFTETQTASLQGEIGSSIGAGVGVTKIFSNRTKGSQILRKSTVQTTFKELYEYEKESLAIKPAPVAQKIPKIHNCDELMAMAQISDGWIINPDNLARGNLFELEVQLEADSIFRISAMTSAILEIIEEDAGVFGLDPSGDLAQVKSVGRILEKLLVGLVPIRGRSVDYCVIEFKGKEWIINRRLLDELKDADLLIIRPFYVVGVAEQGLFWKDIRHILFSKAHYRVFCRVAQDGLHDSWTPVKLAQVFESVVPGLTGQMNFSGLDAIAKLTGTEASGSNQSNKLKHQLMHDALLNYAKLLADHYQLNFSQQNFDEVRLISEEHCASFNSQEERYKAFEFIAKYIIDKFSIKREALIFAQYRSSALTDAGLDFSGNPIPLVISHNTISSASSQERFLDSEFVAIYW